MDLMINHPRDPLVIRGRLDKCVSSLKVLDTTVHSVPKSKRNLSDSLKASMSECLSLFTSLADDYRLQVSIPEDSKAFVALLGLPLPAGRKDPVKHLKKLASIAEIYVTAIQTLVSELEAEIHAAAAAPLDNQQKLQRLTVVHKNFVEKVKRIPYYIKNNKNDRKLNVGLRIKFIDLQRDYGKACRDFDLTFSDEKYQLFLARYDDFQHRGGKASNADSLYKKFITDVFTEQNHSMEEGLRTLAAAAAAAAGR